MGRTSNRLTAKQVEAAKDGWLNDGKNLHLRVGNGGASKKWVLRYARHGKVVEIGLGAVSQGVTLKLARDKRDQHMKGLAQGLDPQDKKRKARAAKEGAKTFAQAAEEVIALRQKKWRIAANDGRTSSLNEWTKSLTVACKPIVSRTVDEIGIDDIKPIVKPYFDNGREASGRRLLNRIEMVFDYAKAHGWRKGDNPATWKIFEHILQAQGPTGPKPHHPALDWRDLPAFMAALRASEPSMAALALEMMVLTACRSGEVRGMLWSEIDFDAATWTVPPERMKRKLPHQAPLSADAVALLRRLEAARINKYVFPGRRSQGPVTNFPVWALAQRLSGRGASPHGFRSSARSWMAAQGVPFDIAEACLAHAVGNAVSQAYNREQLLEHRRSVMERWAQFLSGEDASNVVPLRARSGQ